MAYWLVKTDPDTWSWQDHVRAGTTEWDGVRNHQAANNLRAMRVGDKVFVYHSVQDKQIMGVARVTRTAYLDPSDPTGRFVMVNLEAVEPLQQPVTLEQIKADPALGDLALVRQSRLSVMPIDPDAWGTLSRMGGVKPPRK